MSAAQGTRYFGGRRRVRAVDPEWNAWAYHLLLAYIEHAPAEGFKTEDVRRYCATMDLPEPLDRRMWAPLMVRAKREGRIRLAGTAKHTDPARRGGISTLWVRCSHP